VDFGARVNQTIVTRIVAYRYRDVEAAPQSAGVEELLAGSAYCFGGEDERIPWSLS